MTFNQKFAQLQTFYLAGGGASIGDTSITLQSMLSIDGGTLSMSSDFGTSGFGTLEAGNGNLEEQLVFTGLTNNSNGTVTLTGISNVSFLFPYTQTPGLLKTHAGSATFIISNTSGFYNELTSTADDEVITGLWQFPNGANTPILGTTYVAPTLQNQVASKGYADSIAIAGAPNATTAVQGLVQLPTRAQAAAGTATGSTGASMAIPTSMSSATGASGTTTAVITQTNGTIAPAFIDGTGNYTFSGNTTLSGLAVVISGTTTISGFVNAIPQTANKLVQYDSSGKLPAVDGSQLTNVIHTLIPNWVDEGTLTWSASSADQTLTLTNSGRNIYKVFFSFTNVSSTSFQINLQLNGDTGSSYAYVTRNTTTLTSASGQSSILIAAGNQSAISGELNITGSLTESGGSALAVAGIISNIPGSSQLQSGSWTSSGNLSLSSITMKVNGDTLTGKMHVYSLNL